MLTTSARHPDNGRFQEELSNLLLEQSIRLDQNLYDEAEQRRIEIKLLKRTLAIAKIRLATANDKLNKTHEMREDFHQQNIEQMQATSLQQNLLLLEQELEDSHNQLAQAQEESQNKESSRQKLQQDKVDLPIICR